MLSWRRLDAPRRTELGREPEIKPSSTKETGTAGIQVVQHAGQQRPKVTAVWVIVASIGLLVFAVGLYAIANPIRHYPEMYFYVQSDHGRPIRSAFPGPHGLLCDTPYLFFLDTCADIDAQEFDPQIPAFTKDQSFEGWLVSGRYEGHGCRAIAIRVEGKQYETSEFGWLAPLDAAMPWALLLGFLGTVSATYRIAHRKVLVMVPVLGLPVLVAVVFFSSFHFLRGC
jgi:hypothetical protein